MLDFVEAVLKDTSLIILVSAKFKMKNACNGQFQHCSAQNVPTPIISAIVANVNRNHKAVETLIEMDNVKPVKMTTI